MSKHEESENDFEEAILRNIRITPGTLQKKGHSESFDSKTYLQAVNTKSINTFPAKFLKFSEGIEIENLCEMGQI